MIWEINSPTNEKHLICAQARVAGVSVAQVARRYSMNANLIQKWLRDPRFATDFSDDVQASCHSKQPLIAQLRMPGSSAVSLIPRSLSCCSAVKVRLKGIA